MGGESHRQPCGSLKGPAMSANHEGATDQSGHYCIVDFAHCFRARLEAAGAVYRGEATDRHQPWQSGAPRADSDAWCHGEE